MTRREDELPINTLRTRTTMTRSSAFAMTLIALSLSALTLPLAFSLPRHQHQRQSLLFVSNAALPRPPASVSMRWKSPAAAANHRPNRSKLWSASAGTIGSGSSASQGSGGAAAAIIGEVVPAVVQVNGAPNVAKEATPQSVASPLSPSSRTTTTATAAAATTTTRPSFPLVLWRFTRPHTLIGSALAVPSIFLLAAPSYRDFFTVQSLASLVYAAVPALLMNLYITGLNQITDVEIDRINKPDLPIAKGDLGRTAAAYVVLVALLISSTMSIVHPVFSTPGLQAALWGSFVLGTLYSLPPFRMKRHPLLAAFCIVAVRGTIINAGFYSHALSSAFGGGPNVGVLDCLLRDWKCGASSFFFGVFGIVIALMKDVPDARGDRIFDIRSFTVRLGQGRVFGTMKNLLVALFGAFGAALMRWSAVAPTTGAVVRRGLLGLACWAAARSTQREAVGVDPEDGGQVYRSYMHLWKLFYLSYLGLPFVK